MTVASSDDVSGWAEDSHISGLSLSYPLGYSDRLSAIPFYYWDDREYSMYAAWEHYWDRLSLNVSLYRFPDTDEVTAPFDPAGRGFRVLLTYNH
jgi:hypothetical protein